jgi:putative NADPH-quinone reductase
MVSRRITIIDGHPDPDQLHYVHALADAYERGARAAGHEVRRIAVADLKLPLLCSARDFKSGKPSATVRRCQDDLAWAQHWVILYPLWLGSMPAMLKGFFEQVGRPGFAFGAARGRGLPRKLLAGRSAHVFVTMGMPGFFYRWYYRSHSLKSLERNILAFIGIAPVRSSMVGMVEGVSASVRKKWLQRARALGARAA